MLFANTMMVSCVGSATQLIIARDLLNAQCPMVVDDYTTLQEVLYTSGNSFFQYSYIIDESKCDMDVIIESLSDIAEGIRMLVEAPSNSEFIEACINTRVNALIFQYTGNSSGRKCQVIYDPMTRTITMEKDGVRSTNMVDIPVSVPAAEEFVEAMPAAKEVVEAMPAADVVDVVQAVVTVYEEEAMAEEVSDDDDEYYDTDDEPYLNAEVMPSFQGGDLNSFRNWVQSRLRYPQLATENGIQGNVVLTFVIEKDGRLTNIQVMRTPDLSLSEEAIRVLNQSPKWSPGKQNDQAVRIKYTLPVVFRIQN